MSVTEPGWFVHYMPVWATTRVLRQVALWEWIALLLAVCGLLITILHRLICFILARVQLMWLRALGYILALPAAFVISLTIF